MSSFVIGREERVAGRRISIGAPLPLVVCFCSVLIALGSGCASSIGGAGRAVDPTPPDVSSPPPAPLLSMDSLEASAEPRSTDGTGALASPPPTWSESTREGRNALRARDFDAAEAHFVAAVETARAFGGADVRVDVGFGNLARVASVYERVGRAEDAARVLTILDEAASVREDGPERVARALERYERLVNMSLSTRLTPPEMMLPKFNAPYDHLIRRTAISYDVDPALVKAVVAAESNFEPRAVSRVGAQGLMQLMPRTARAMGVRRPFAPSENIRGGVRYLRSLLDRFQTLDHALAAYNAGPEAVVRYGGIPPYPETEAYVTRVLAHYRRYQTSFNR